MNVAIAASRDEKSINEMIKNHIFFGKMVIESH